MSRASTPTVELRIRRSGEPYRRLKLTRSPASIGRDARSDLDTQQDMFFRGSYFAGMQQLHAQLGLVVADDAEGIGEAVAAALADDSDDARERRRFHLHRSYYGLYVPPMIWRELDNFSSGSVCLVLVSTVYDAADYIRDYELFTRETGPRR